MAIAVTNPGVGLVGFFLNATSANLSGGEELKAAVVGKSIYVDHITISSDGAITITIGEGETGDAVTTALIGPTPFAANSFMQWTFLNGGMKLTAATSLSCDASGAANVNIFASGRVE